MTLVIFKVKIFKYQPFHMVEPMVKIVQGISENSPTLKGLIIYYGMQPLYKLLKSNQSTNNYNCVNSKQNNSNNKPTKTKNKTKSCKEPQASAMKKPNPVSGVSEGAPGKVI